MHYAAGREPGGQAGSTSEHFSHPPVEPVSVPYRPDGQVAHSVRMNARVCRCPLGTDVPMTRRPVPCSPPVSVVEREDAREVGADDVDQTLVGLIVRGDDEAAAAQRGR
jgi:hypothetical protein